MTKIRYFSLHYGHECMQSQPHQSGLRYLYSSMRGQHELSSRMSRTLQLTGHPEWAISSDTALDSPAHWGLHSWGALEVRKYLIAALHRDGFEDLHDLRKERVRLFINDEAKNPVMPGNQNPRRVFGQPGFSTAAHGFRQLSL